jgi:hypothetical protein
MSHPHHNLLLSIAVVGIACVSIPPVWADDPKATTAQAKSRASHIVALPKAIVGFCAGAIVGTPICFVRQFPKEVTQGAHGFVGSIVSNENNKLLFLPACVLWLPVAGVVTTLEAPGYAVKDAYTAEKAFSKEQFSLGELDP